MKIDKKILIISLIVVALTISNVLTLVWLKKENKRDAQLIDQTESANFCTASSSCGATKEETPELPKDSIDSVRKLGANELEVDWQQWPVLSEAYSLYDFKDLHKYLVENHDKTWSENDSNLYVNAFKAYEVGRVKTGNYVGRRMYILTFREPEGPSFGPNVYRVIEASAMPGEWASSTNKAIILGKLSQEPYDMMKRLFQIDTEAVVANLEPANQISIPDSALKLVKMKTEPFKFLTDYKDAKKLFKYDEENYIYKSDSNGCFVVAAKDGMAREYVFDLPFVVKSPDEIDERTDPRNAPLLLNFSLDGRTATSGEYTMRKVGGCGAVGCYDYATYIKDQEPLTSVGKFSNGDSIYVLKDKNFSYQDEYGNMAKVLQDKYNQYSPGWDEKTQKEKAKITFDEFVAGYPLLFWRDPFGKYIALSSAKYMSGVECGKPVIYLYPTETTTVSVKVAPAGGFSVTEPAYNDSWQVEAKPNGELRNLADNKIYPYLFWEGRALDYQRPVEGFVVAKNAVENFLTSKLAILGLNQKEAGEFMEYWLPRMQSKSYYFITFVPQADFERLAPLSVQPRPDTTIRVFMDYQGLEKPIKVRQQRIKTPIRRGFTVVEWGGALHN